MASLEMPVRSDFKSYELTLTLNSVVFILRFYFNTRLNSWVMQLKDSTGTVILGGVPVQTNVSIIAQYIYDNFPLGEVVPIDETGEERNPGEEDLGNDIKMIYVEPDEVA